MAIVIILTTVVGCSNSNTTSTNSSGASNISDNGPVNLDLATMKMGSGWYSYGSVLTELMLQELPEGSKINIIPESGAAANPTLVSKGKFPFGLGYNQSCNWAYNGNFIYDEPLENLRGLVGYLDTYYYAAVVSKAFGVTDLAEVAEKKLPIRVSTVPVGGMGEIVTRLVFEYYGFTYDDIKSWGGKVEHNDFFAEKMRIKFYLNPRRRANSSSSSSHIGCSSEMPLTLAPIASFIISMDGVEYILWKACHKIYAYADTEMKRKQLKKLHHSMLQSVHHQLLRMPSILMMKSEGFTD